MPAPELSWWQRALLAWMEGATGLRATTPHVGDAVMTRTEEGTLTTATIEAVEAHRGASVVVDLVVGGETLGIVPGHVLLTHDGWFNLPLMTSDRAFATAGNEEVGCTVRNPRVVVGTVYNLRVRNGNTYLVGREGLAARDH